MELTLLSPKQCTCGKQGHIVDSRQCAEHVYRRYNCDCGSVWTTTEIRSSAPEQAIFKKMKDQLADQLIAMAQDLMKP